MTSTSQYDEVAVHDSQASGLKALQKIVEAEKNITLDLPARLIKMAFNFFLDFVKLEINLKCFGKMFKYLNISCLTL